ncbi:MAG: GAF domain-containing protein [Terricaulis sp.]
MKLGGANKTAFLDGGGEMGALIRAFDWARHPLGDPARWPQPLRTTLRLLLNTGHPMYIWWGPQLYCFYNDAYCQSIGPERHPGSLGSPGREVWEEIWPIIGPQIDQVMSGGGATWHVNALVPITRNGRREEVYWTYSYGPIDDDASPNGVGGVLVVCTETTEAVLAQRAKTEEVARQRRLFEQAPGFVIIMNGPDHVVDFVNDVHRQVFSSGDWVGRTIRDAFPSIAGQGFYELLDKVFATGETVEFQSQEVRYRRSPNADEELHFFTFIYAPLYDANGKITGVFCDGFDVTLAHRAQGEMRASEDRLRLATEAASIGTWDFNPETNELRWDERCRRHFDVSADAAISYEETFLAALHPADRERTHRAVTAALAPDGDGKYDIEYRVIGRGDGVERWIAATGNAIFENGRAARFVGTVRDISEQKRAQRRLEIVNRTGAAVAAELQLDNIVQMITDAGVELSGAEFGAFFYNLTDASGESYMLYALSGVAREEFSKFPMPRNTAVFAPTFNGEGVVRSDDIIQDERYGKNAPRKGMPEGHLPVRSYLAVPVISLSGEVHGGLFFGHAQPGMFKTEHETLVLGLAGQAATAIDNARLFQQLQKLNATLEQRVAEEVAERARAEEQLRQSQKMEAIGQLTGGIAHDFNNMLAVVIGGLNMMQRRLAKGDVDVGRFIEAATDGAKRAAALTQRLLAFSRQQPLEPDVIDANKLVGSMTDLLRRTLGEQVEVETVLLAGLWRTFADPLQLEATILNLAVNARDAMPEGGKLTIETANAAVDDEGAKEYALPAGQYVMVAVTDTGAGMSAAIMEKAFDPFFTTKAVGKGTGLGLSQVFGFVRQSGGHVKLYSEERIGTTVKVYLPRHYGSDAPRNIVSERASPQGGKGEVVLVVEDEERVRNYSTEALKELGYNVIAASGGADALALIESGQKIDLLFTDVVMPGMNGRQLAEKANEKLPQLKVLFTTGYTRNAVMHNGVLDAGTSILPKPFSIDQLAAKIRGVLDA